MPCPQEMADAYSLEEMLQKTNWMKLQFPRFWEISYNLRAYFKFKGDRWRACITGEVLSNLGDCVCKWGMPSDPVDDVRERKQAFFKAKREFVLLFAQKGPLHQALKEAITAYVDGRDPISLSMSITSLTTARTEANLIAPFQPLGLCIHHDISCGWYDSWQRKILYENDMSGRDSDYEKCLA